MAKRKSQLELAILGIEDEIAALELARNHLIRQRPLDRTARKPAAPRAVKTSTRASGANPYDGPAVKDAAS